MLPTLALQRPEAQTLATGVAKLALEYYVTLCYNLGRYRPRSPACSCTISVCSVPPD